MPKIACRLLGEEVAHAIVTAFWHRPPRLGPFRGPVAVLTYHFLPSSRVGRASFFFFFFSARGITPLRSCSQPLRRGPCSSRVRYRVAPPSTLHNHLRRVHGLSFHAANRRGNRSSERTLLVAVSRAVRTQPLWILSSSRYRLLAVAAGPLVAGSSGGIVSSISVDGRRLAPSARMVARYALGVRPCLPPPARTPLYSARLLRTSRR